MKLPRSSGILLHPTSLPGRYGIGSLGEAAYRFVDFLAESGQSWWQVMPLGPTGYGDSPYQSFSAFAGNPMLLSIEWLADDGLIDPAALDDAPDFPRDRVEYGAVIEWKMGLLSGVYERFKASAPQEEHQAYIEFVEKNRYWLEDYALFSALKKHFNTAWNEWDADIRRFEPQAVAAWRERMAGDVARERLLQYLF
jgi:4-alpha-glucanotransferase